MLALYLPRSTVHGRVLHFAPESMLQRTIGNLATSYVTTDIQEGIADVSADIANLPFADDEWDGIVCSHVLEHVPDDRAAMAELRRVLAPAGTAVIVVPRLAGAATDEDPSVTDAAERTRRFGQHDHVRLYGEDLEDRLKDAGFARVTTIRVDELPDADRHGLRNTIAGPADALICCS
jgi:SAM-dependent methyltransferase